MSCRSLLLLLLLIMEMRTTRIIDNGLAPPEILHQAITSQPRCHISAAPLDLIFVLDSSGSLRDRFQDEIDVIRRIVQHVTISDSATRIALIQFSGVQHLEFDFNAFSSRDGVMAALSVLRHVSGITRIGGAFKFAMDFLSDQSTGIRDSSVPKILYLLSDGRTHDYPMDLETVAALRKFMPQLQIWAYGTGDYVAMPALLNYTQSPEKIVTNENLNMLESLFNQWHGVEICEALPACVKGSDKPLDLVLIIDSSESVNRLFQEQINFAIDRIIKNINIHPEAVKMSLITFSGKPFVHFTFKDQQFWNNSEVVNHLKTLRSIKGTTSTHLALEAAIKILFDDFYGARQNVTKMVIVLTDGHAHKTPASEAEKLRQNGCTIFAIAVMTSLVNSDELMAIAGDPDHVFTPQNLHLFEHALTKFVGFNCMGIELGPDSVPFVRGATDVSCNANSMQIRVRTRKPMNGGIVYAQLHHDDEICRVKTTGISREVSIKFLENTCGMTKTPTKDGYLYNVTIILQFHSLIQTRADQGLDISCLHPINLNPVETRQISQQSLAETTCSHRLHRYSPLMCVALDAKVGETLYHKWDCDIPDGFGFLVHDCLVKSERSQFWVIDSAGCETDVHFLETPSYDRLANYTNNTSKNVFVWQEMSVFKFPGDSNIQFICKVSICDMQSANDCVNMIPPKCSESSTASRTRPKRENGSDGFVATLETVSHSVNVLESENTRPHSSVKFCDIF